MYDGRKLKFIVLAITFYACSFPGEVMLENTSFNSSASIELHKKFFCSYGFFALLVELRESGLGQY